MNHTQEEVTPVFCYGSLRPGHWNHGIIEPAVTSVVYNVTTPGHVWLAYDSPHAYPVAKFMDTEDRVIGDIVYVRTDSVAYERMVEMELSSGYEKRVVPCLTPEGRTIIAEAFHYIWTPRGHLFIESGNWAATQTDGSDWGDFQTFIKSLDNDT